MNRPLVVVALLGAVLLNRITTGLLNAKRDSALVEATSGFAEAQSLVDASDKVQSAAASQLVDQIVAVFATHPQTAQRPARADLGTGGAAARQLLVHAFGSEHRVG